MPVNQNFMVGEEASILISGGAEVSGIVESLTTSVNNTILTMSVDGTPTAFEFVRGQWNQMDTDASTEILEEAA